jgi:hypothetical protein
MDYILLQYLKHNPSRNPPNFIKPPRVNIVFKTARKWSSFPTKQIQHIDPVLILYHTVYCHPSSAPRPSQLIQRFTLSDHKFVLIFLLNSACSMAGKKIQTCTMNDKFYGFYTTAESKHKVHYLVNSILFIPAICMHQDNNVYLFYQNYSL